MSHVDEAQLAAASDHIRSAPADNGSVELIVRRPAVGERTVLHQARFTFADGLEGDTWNVRASKRTEDGSPHPDMQLNIINARVSTLIAVDSDRRALAGDQLHLDLDLSLSNLPAGTQLAIGDAVIEITDQPHNGCAKFTERFGLAAHRWVNSDDGKALRLRGANARVIREGAFCTGDRVRKVSQDTLTE